MPVGNVPGAGAAVDTARPGGGATVFGIILNSVSTRTPQRSDMGTRAAGIARTSGI